MRAGIEFRGIKIASRLRRAVGFTLIELIGVLAIVAILASVITPRVVGTIGRGRVNATVQSHAGLKSATTAYVARYGSLPVRDGTGATNGAVTTGRFDADLVTSGFVDRLFTCGIGSQLQDNSALTGRTHVRSQTALASGTVTITSTVGGNNFDLDDNTATADFTTANMIVAVAIPNVTASQAVELNRLIDQVTNTSLTAADTTGRCIYSAPSSGGCSSGGSTVYLYVMHY